jgi:hypothetical protein
MADISKAETPFGNFQYSNAFFDFMKTWTNSLYNNGKSLSDWRIWLPRAFYLNWSDPPTWQRSMADPSIWMPIIFFPQEERERILNIINIAGDYVAGNKAGRDYIQGDQIGRDKIQGNMIKDIENPAILAK